MINIENKLNPAQLEAVNTLHGPALVIAGAGSGKTRVIEYRVLNLVQNEIDPSSIILLTFTREASRKMLERATRHDLRCRRVAGGTFHSFGYRLLRKYGKDIGIAGSFTILDEDDSSQAIHRCASAMGSFDKEERFPKKETLRSIISTSVNKNIPINKILENDFEDFIVYTDEIELLKKKYAEYKLQNNLFDYDDLLVFTKVLLQDKNISGRVSSLYKFIMIDEYQDTNKLQADIAYLLAKDSGRNIMVVGDDAQSIYGFRGASHENIMAFPRLFPECKIIKLEENYRSTQNILNLANSILLNMENKYSKCLISARKEPGEKAKILFFSNIYDEAEWIAKKIKELRDEGKGLEHQAVLFRSSYISIPLQAELSKRNIPYQVFGGLKFYETAHVKDLLAYFKIIVNPRDELSWNRIFLLIDGIGPKTSNKIIRDISPYSALEHITEKLSIDYCRKFKFSDELKRLKEAVKKACGKNINIEGQFEIMLEYYYPILKNKYDDWRLRLNDLEVLKQLAAKYALLDELLADFAIELPEKAALKIGAPANRDESPLTLSTVHSSKGLEWDSVFVLGLMEGFFPVSFSLNDREEIEEEHRLFYVAVTRAKNSLFMSLHYETNRNGLFQFNKISRFVNAPNILEQLDKQVIVTKDNYEDELLLENL